jgi:hypothetical protein
MKMALGTFLSFALHAGGCSPAALVSSALLHYREVLASDEPPPKIPAFLGAPESGEEIDVSVEPELERELRAEARRQGVEVERLLLHAVLVYLADLDRAGECPETPAARKN